MTATHACRGLPAIEANCSAARVGPTLSRGGRAFRCALLATMLAAYLISLLCRPEEFPSLPLCGFRALTGAECPSCGMTRSFLAIGHGQLCAAWQFNALSLPVYLGGLLLAPLLLWEGVTGKDIIERRLRAHRLRVYAVLGAAIVFRYAMAG